MDVSKMQVQLPIKRGDETIIINVDPIIAPLIQILNEKGFYTEYSCSGHEEDAYLGFYIKFYKMDPRREEIIKRIVSSIKYLYVEDCYDLNADIAVSSNYVSLVDPKAQELDMAKKIVFRRLYNNEAYVEENTYHYIVIRLMMFHYYTMSNIQPEDISLNNNLVRDYARHLEHAIYELYNGICNL